MGWFFFEQFLESVIRPFANIINFGMNIAAGHVIWISALFGLILFLIMLTNQPENEHNPSKP